ncbi:hypothetical protein Taro_038412, partial [Colocasia esculenta]|nr:hypothetical protein [Colocasia esculenta]
MEWVHRNKYFHLLVRGVERDGWKFVLLASLAGAAVASTTGSKRSHLSSYLFPTFGIASSILISLRIKKYSSQLSVAAELKSTAATETSDGHDNVNGASDRPHEALRKRH